VARLLALLALVSLPGTAAEPLRGPVDVGARRAAIGRVLPPPAPWIVLPPIRDLTGTSYYIDPHRSVADPALRAKNQAAFAPLRAFVARIADLADRWTVSRPAAPADAVHAIQALAAWARGGALLGAVNQQGQYERQWTLAGLALAYLRVRDAPGVAAAERLSVERWLVNVARAVMPNYGHAGRMSSANNHAYWAGLAVAAAGAAAQDHALYDWGLGQARIGIAQVRADGFLPLELERRALALHYHLFALAPLVMTAELAAANGLDLYKEGDGALRRLADRVIAGLIDPAPFVAAAGTDQELIPLPARGPDLAWAEPYFARFHDRRLAPLLAAARPLRDDRLGGDMTAAFGVPDLK
jgi:poly(beta-D-mannuronate) lyase